MDRALDELPEEREQFIGVGRVELLQDGDDPDHERRSCERLNVHM